MSNEYVLRCLQHQTESATVGNNNAKYASLVVQNQEGIAKIVELLQPLEIDVHDLARSHWNDFMTHAIMFVAEHPICNIELHDEYGARIPMENEPDPHEGEDQYCSKCGGRITSTGIASGELGTTIWLPPACINDVRDRDQIRFVYWFKRGYEHPGATNDRVVEEIEKMENYPGFKDGWSYSVVGKLEPHEIESKALEFYELQKKKNN